MLVHREATRPSQERIIEVQAGALEAFLGGGERVLRSLLRPVVRRQNEQNSTPDPTLSTDLSTRHEALGDDVGMALLVS